MPEDTQYCPWCVGGVAPTPDADSRICEQHYADLLRQLAEYSRRKRHDTNGNGRSNHPSPTSRV